MKVCVLGAGPAGLMAAYAAIEAGHEVKVIDKAIAYDIGQRLASGQLNAGVFLLHDRCGLLPLWGRDEPVIYGVMGGDLRRTSELGREYSLKVYGAPNVDTSINKYGLAGPRIEYDGTAATWLLFDIVKPFIVQGDVTLDTLIAELNNNDRVISTVPLSVLHPGEMPHVQAWVKHGSNKGESYVWYAPQPALAWYRASAAFGRFTLEWPGHIDQPDPGARRIVKPIKPSPEGQAFIDAWEATNHVLFTGRFGRWDKSIEQHNVYEAVLEFLR